MKPLGCQVWAIADGHIPLMSHGEERTFSSHDKLCILNTGDQAAQVEVIIYYQDADPDGPYPLQIAPQRVRHMRINDLINPRAVPLDVPYGLVITSNVDVIVQFSRRDTSRSENAIMTTLAHPVRGG
jgi:hypothetical protein